MYITITKIDSVPSWVEKDNYFIRCYTNKGDVVLLWGSIEEGTRNINALVHQRLPVTIFIESPEECGFESIDDKYRKNLVIQMKASMNIEEHTQIVILADDSMF